MPHCTCLCVSCTNSGHIHLQISLTLFSVWPNRATEAKVGSYVHSVKSMLPGKTYPEGYCMSGKSLTSKKPLETWQFTLEGRLTCQDWVVQGKGPYLAKEPYWSWILYLCHDLKQAHFLPVPLCSSIIPTLIHAELIVPWIRQGCPDTPNCLQFTH